VIRVLLADDQALVRGALAAMLGLEQDIEVVAAVGSGDEVVDTARHPPPTSHCSTCRCPVWTGWPRPRGSATRCPAAA
jgi:DNA-binding NarL/FixJ family response regulator